MAEVRCARRYYLLNALTAEATLDEGLASAWRAKQLAQSGTPLPPTFPFAAQLAEIGYLAVEDLDGADANEMEQSTELNPEQIEAVLQALDALLS